MENSSASTEKRISDIEKTLEHMKGLILECANKIDPFFSEKKRFSEGELRRQKDAKELCNRHPYTSE